MSRVTNRRRFVPLLLADDYQSQPPNPPGDGDGDGDPPNDFEDLCAVTITNGGGDTFDCYDDSDLVKSLPDQGTGWDGVWSLSNGYGHVNYDHFDDYSDGSDFGDLNKGDEWGGDWVTDMESQETMALLWRLVGLGGTGSTLTELTGDVPDIGSVPDGSLIIIGIFHRSAIVGGLDGWTLIKTESVLAPGLGITQYNSVYSIPASLAPAQVTVQQASAGRLMFVLGLICPIDNELAVTADSRTYVAAANPGGHPLVDLAAVSDGTLAVHFSACVLASTSTVSWTFTNGWYAVAGISDPNNRYAVGAIRLDNGESTGEGPWLHPYSGEHAGAEITVLFRG